MKRFYVDVTVAARDDGWQVMLDRRAVRTASGREQRVPSPALAEALAAEWRDQGDEIDPARFILRDQADYAIDCVAPDRAGAIGKLVAFAETDTLCYRAAPEEALYRRQLEQWDPLLEGVEQRLGVRFVRTSGVLHRPQPAETLAALRTHLATLDDFSLAALHALAALAASLAVALAAAGTGRGPGCAVGLPPISRRTGRSSTGARMPMPPGCGPGARAIFSLLSGFSGCSARPENQVPTQPATCRATSFAARLSASPTGPGSAMMPGSTASNRRVVSVPSAATRVASNCTTTDWLGAS